MTLYDFHVISYIQITNYSQFLILSFRANLLQTYRTNRVDSAGTGWSSSIIAGVHLLRRGSIVTGAGGPVIAAAWSPPPQSTHIIEIVWREDYLLFQLVLPCTCRPQFHQGTHMLVCCCQNTWVSLLHSGRPWMGCPASGKRPEPPTQTRPLPVSSSCCWFRHQL